MYKILLRFKTFGVLRFWSMNYGITKRGSTLLERQFHNTNKNADKNTKSNPISKNPNPPFDFRIPGVIIK